MFSSPALQLGIPQNKDQLDLQKVSLIILQNKDQLDLQKVSLIISLFV